MLVNIRTYSADTDYVMCQNKHYNTMTKYMYTNGTLQRDSSTPMSCFIHDIVLTWDYVLQVKIDHASVLLWYKLTNRSCITLIVV